MKVILEQINDGDEEEIIIRSNSIDEKLLKLINQVKISREKIHGYMNESIKLIEPDNIYYFEAVDNKVFAYCEKEIFEVRFKLYELEERFKNTDFIRASKSAVINISKIVKLTPSISGRFEVLLANGEKTIISRQYVPVLKEKLGL